MNAAVSEHHQRELLAGQVFPGQEGVSRDDHRVFGTGRGRVLRDARGRSGVTNPVHASNFGEGLKQHLFVDPASQELFGEVERSPKVRAFLVRAGRRIDLARL
jgi:hypothetical protein